MQTKCFSYIRTSGEDRVGDKLGIPVQRGAVSALTEFEVVHEFVDDGVTGKIPMHARPQGKLLIAALLADGVKTVLCYDGRRIGRTQPAFWSFIGMARDNGIAVFDKDRVNLCESVQGGIQGLMSELDHQSTVARLQAGKVQHRALGRRVEGRWPYGDSPHVKHIEERAVVARIRDLNASGVSSYAIAKRLNAKGTRTRYGCEFTTKTIQNILNRKPAAK
jgi:site-specific DNA recombinase